MLDVLADNPVLALFLVIALGSLVGLIPFGPVRFGAAGALFVGLALGALDDRLGEGLGLVRTIGLSLFVYTIGLASGPAFFRTLRRQAPVMGGSVGVLVLVAVAVVATGRALGVGADHLAGVFAGAGTSTPALEAATRAAGGSEDPAVGYALSYPVAVLVGILAVQVVLGRRREGGSRDRPSAAATGLTDLTVVVSRRTRLLDVPGAAEGEVRFSYWQRGDDVEVVSDRDVLEPGDRVVIIGPVDAVAPAVRWLGSRAQDHLAHDRRDVDYRRVLLSNPDLSGRSIAELGIGERFGGVVTRVRRGDLDLLARDDLHVQLGDRLRVVVPRGRIREVSRFLGDTERKVSEVDAVSLALGLSLGFLVGLVTVTVGPVSLSLGVAAGPLVVGIVLGRLERTGPIVWSLPTGAALTLRQTGLLLFLASVGLSSGPALAESITQPIGSQLVLLGLGAAAAGVIAMVVLTSRLDLSSARSAGLVAGFVGNPSILAFANSKVADERVDDGYATLLAVDQVTKVLLVQLIVALAG
ncbi:MAG TPA: TrkA C-terminal domain-containing protein [Jiangellales bacterium]|nr:TrkA C-terminal domain-containing protein [Jiangellales bacterium]